MELFRRFRVLGVGTDPEANVNRAEQFEAQQHQVELRELEDEAWEKSVRRRSEVRREMFKEWGTALLDFHADFQARFLFGVPFLAFIAMTTLVVIAWVWAAFGTVTAIVGPIPGAYYIEQGSVNAVAWSVKWKPSWANPKVDNGWENYAAPTEAENAYQILQELREQHPGIPAKLTSAEYKPYCWQVTQWVRWGDNRVVTPCYKDYDRAVVALEAFKSGNLEKLSASRFSGLPVLPTEVPNMLPSLKADTPDPAQTRTSVLVVPEDVWLETVGGVQATASATAEDLLGVQWDEVVYVDN